VKTVFVVTLLLFWVQMMIHQHGSKMDMPSGEFFEARYPLHSSGESAPRHQHITTPEFAVRPLVVWSMVHGILAARVAAAGTVAELLRELGLDSSTHARLVCV
jgi:hypothetical protein